MRRVHSSSGRIFLPTSPESVHLGFDIPWYVDVATDEDDDPAEEEWRIKSTTKDNTTWFWAVGVLSITTPGRNDVLGFEPIGDAKEYDQVLDTMLKRVEARLNLTFGRIYLDSGLGNTKIMGVCEAHGLNWLIQGDKWEARGACREGPARDTGWTEGG